MIKRFILAASAILCGAAFLCQSASAIVKPQNGSYVSDYANVLSENTEKFIQEHSEALDKKTTAQIVVVTVNNLEGKDIESYANELFNDWGIGDKDKNNGLLILLSIEERRSRIEVGYGLEGILPDGKTGRFQDSYMIPYYKDDHFDEGMLNGYKAFFAEVAKEYGYDASNIEVVDKAADDEKAENASLISVISFLAPFFVPLGRRKNLKQKLFYFSILEIITIILAFIAKTFIATAFLPILIAGTIINIFVAFIDWNEKTGSSGFSPLIGWGSSSGSSSGGFSGGGGHSGGGGSSRSF